MLVLVYISFVSSKLGIPLKDEQLVGVPCQSAEDFLYVWLVSKVLQAKQVAGCAALLAAGLRLCAVPLGGGPGYDPEGEPPKK